jgi:NHL repeat/WD40-like Beta Propeller Repeat
MNAIDPNGYFPALSSPNASGRDWPANAGARGEPARLAERVGMKRLIRRLGIKELRRPRLGNRGESCWVFGLRNGPGKSGVPPLGDRGGSGRGAAGEVELCLDYVHEPNTEPHCGVIVRHTADEPNSCQCDKSASRRERTPRRFAWFPAVVCATVISLGFMSSPAFAKQLRLFSSSFGSEHSLPAATPEADRLVEPWGVAVDEATRDVYVADPGHHRVEEFTATGEFVLMFGKEVNETKMLSKAPEPEQNVCTAVSGDVCKDGDAASTPGAFPEGQALYVAVDNSTTGASKGDVYVGSRVENLTAGEDENVVQKFNTKGELISGWGKEGQLNGSSVTTGIGVPLAGPFDQLNGIAVDTKGNLWVYGTGLGEKAIEEGWVFEFAQDGSFANNDWTTGESPRVGFAVDPEENVYTYNGVSLEKFTATGTRIGQVTETGVRPEAVAVDSVTGDLYVGTGSEERFRVLRYARGCVIRGGGGGCAPAEEFTSAHLHYARGLAVDGAAPGVPVFASEVNAGEVAGFTEGVVPEVTTVKASGFAAGVATLNGLVNPSGVRLNAGEEGCRFEWGETREPYEHTIGCESKTPLEGTSPVSVYKTITGLVAGRTYHFRLVAANANDVDKTLEVDEPSFGGDLSFGPPLVESESVSGVTATGATFAAQVAPNNVDTHVQIEYGTSTEYGEHGSLVDVGSGEAAAGASWPVTGLVAATTYHYRVRAESVLGTVYGEDHVFATQRAAVSGLLDGREWEMVSPVDKHDATIEPVVAELNFAIQAAATGDGMTYVTTAPVESVPAGNSNLNQILSTRATAGGWSSDDIAIGHAEATGISINSQEYRAFSEDLSLGLLQPFGGFDAALSAEASEQTPYLRDDATGSYRPLVTAAAGGNVPEEVNGKPVRFGVPQFHEGSCPPEPECGPEFLGATPGLDHVVFFSKAPLVEGAPENMVYEWSAGSLQLVSVLPDGKPDAAGARPHLGQYGIARSSVVRHAISADGSRVVWEDENDSRLFLRDVASGETVLIGAGRFEDASSDDSRVFFSEGGELRECELVEEPGNLHCVNTTLGVLTGTVIGASEDASFVYYVAGGNELTVFHDGVSVPIAELSSEDSRDWDGDHEIEPLPFLTARVSPDGRWLAFMSDRELTGYDNHDAVSGVPDEEVFLYHAAAGVGEAGGLVCASCNPTGERPDGVEYRRIESGVAGGGTWLPTTWLAGSVPGWTSEFYQSRYLSDGGRLFFDSSDALVAGDTNRTEDVYEYEPPAGGEETPDGDTCTETASSYSQASDGCIALVSSGVSPEESGFLDASEDGDDVFFLTTAKLVAGDLDRSLDVYDAHVCSGGAPCPTAAGPGVPVCEGDGCHAIVEAPGVLTPGSLSFKGPTNITPPPPPPPLALTNAQKLTKALRVCRKDHSKKKRVSCEKTARKRYPPKKATKAKKAEKAGSSRRGGTG